MRRVLMACGALLLVAGPAHAQADRLTIVANGGALVAPGSFGQDFTLTRNLEPAPVTTDLSLATGGAFEAGVRVRVGRRLGIGVVGFAASSTASGTLEAQIPHPLYFKKPRDVSGDLSDLTRKERGAHVELAVPLHSSDGGDLTLFGGPSYFDIEQDLVTDLSYSDSYPFDTATLDDTTSSTVKEAGYGFNVGLEYARQISRSARVALLGRYSRGTLTLSAAEGNEAEVHAGGIFVGVGLRFGFGR